MRIFLAIFVFAIITAVSILGFRGSVSTKPPLEVFPDMDRQPRYKPQAENDFFADGRNDRPVPAGTVARGSYFNQAEVFSAEFEDARLDDTIFHDGKDAEGNFVLAMPLEASYELIEQGREHYDIFCASCHGAAGDGNGVTKPYGVIATSYHSDRLRSIEDGYIYDVIMHGKGLMYGLEDRLSPEESWAIVLYVRALQLSQNAKAEELTAAQRTELGF